MKTKMKNPQKTQKPLLLPTLAMPIFPPLVISPATLHIPLARYHRTIISSLNDI